MLVLSDPGGRFEERQSASLCSLNGVAGDTESLTEISAPTCIPRPGLNGRRSSGRGGGFEETVPTKFPSPPHYPNHSHCC